MRVLFSSTFGHGHVFPLLPLATAFRDAGHDVLWAAPSGVSDLLGDIPLARAGLDGPELGLTLRGLSARAEEHPPAERAAFMFPTMFGETLTPPMVPDLLALAREWRPDLLVHEASELASPLVGALLDLPSVTQSFGGAVPEPFLAEASRRLEPLWAAHGLTIPPYAGCYETVYVDICPPSVQPVSIAHISRTLPMRPVTALPAVAPAGPPRVYLTLGTVQNHRPVLAVALGSLAQLDIRVLVTVGPDGDPAVLGDQPAHVQVERFVPQAEVLTDCAVVVSHAGSGTFLGALASSLPQLCLPQAADQFRNASAAVKAGAALVLTPDEASGEAIAAAVGRLLDEPSFRVAARAVGDEISLMPGPDQVVEALARL